MHIYTSLFQLILFLVENKIQVQVIVSMVTGDSNCSNLYNTIGGSHLKSGVI